MDRDMDRLAFNIAFVARRKKAPIAWPSRAALPAASRLRFYSVFGSAAADSRRIAVL
jgi:hypothetical protein